MRFCSVRLAVDAGICASPRGSWLDPFHAPSILLLLRNDIRNSARVCISRVFKWVLQGTQVPNLCVVDVLGYVTGYHSSACIYPTTHNIE